ncbi:MAG: hypothetical protein J2P31_07255 [Blastocatellia bacterium]|nr:hypothetical protein [Blastocatellia bacterium]
MNHPFDSFILTPMSAGDIIDHAVRLYRRNFLVLLRIVLAPSLVAFGGAMLYTIGVRNISLLRGDLRLLATGSMIALGIILIIIGKAAFYAVLGGASRSLVHLFFDGTPLRARAVYQAVRERLWSLVGATILLALLAGGIAVVIIIMVAFLIPFYTFFVASMISVLPFWVQFISHLIFGLLVAALVIVTSLLCYSRIIYVPQVLMVEGKNVSASIGRSFTLAGGEMRRIAAIILFWFYVAWSLWLLLMVPPGWYAFWTGVDISPFAADEPIWYSIVQQTLTQVSEILIAPVVMLGFTLLYLDSRVRKEGFDIELLANRVLAAPPEWSHPELTLKTDEELLNRMKSQWQEAEVKQEAEVSVKEDAEEPVVTERDDPAQQMEV